MSGWSTSGWILLILGIILLVIGVIDWSVRGSGEWWTWLLIGGGAVLSIIGIILLVVHSSKCENTETVLYNKHGHIEMDSGGHLVHETAYMTKQVNVNHNNNCNDRELITRRENVVPVISTRTHNDHITHHDHITPISPTTSVVTHHDSITPSPLVQVVRRRNCVEPTVRTNCVEPTVRRRNCNNANPSRCNDMIVSNGLVPYTKSYDQASHIDYMPVQHNTIPHQITVNNSSHLVGSPRVIHSTHEIMV